MLNYQNILISNTNVHLQDKYIFSKFGKNDDITICCKSQKQIAMQQFGHQLGQNTFSQISYNNKEYVIMKNTIFYGKRSFMLCLSCLAFFFWICFFIQTVSVHFPVSTNEAIPAFLNTHSNISSNNAFTPFSQDYADEFCQLNQTTIRLPISCLSPQKTSDSFSDTAAVTTFLKQYDSRSTLLSSHKEKNYTDFYFYCPQYAKYSTSSINSPFTLQAAITAKYLYIGIPFISYDF